MRVMISSLYSVRPLPDYPSRVPSTSSHAEMARNIPLLFVKHEWNTDMKEFVVVPNPDFIAEAKRRFAPTDTILVMCRAGDRSALAVNALAKAGFVNVYNIIDGMKGDKVDDPGYAYHGKWMRDRPGPIPSIRSRHACQSSRSDVFFEDLPHSPAYRTREEHVITCHGLRNDESQVWPGCVR
jgi:rhodanese-related sulfurtransferase